MSEATVAAIVITTDNNVEKILLTRRGIEPFKGQWCLPGGHIDQYETTRDAIFREVKEETGLDFRAQFFGSFDEIIPKYGIHAVVLVYKGQGVGELNPQTSEVEDMRWFSISEALSLPLAFAHHDILEAYVCNISKSVNNDSKSGILEEYSTLRSEILKRMEMRQQMLTFTLVIAGTFLTLEVGFGKTLVLLIFPILSMLLALVWMQSDVRVGEIGEYIRSKVASRLKDVEWESFIRQKYANKSFRLVEVSAFGVFLVTEILSVALAIPKLTFSSEEIALLVLDGVAIILTFLFIRRRRVVLYSEEV